MADRNISNNETQIYGPKLRAALSRDFSKSAPQVKIFLTYLIGLQSNADTRMAKGMTEARGAQSHLTAAAGSKTPVAAEARTLLQGFHKHLESKRHLGQWKGDIKAFFPKGLSGIGTSAPSIAAALASVQGAFQKDSSVPDGKALSKRLSAAEKKLRAEIEKGGGAVAKARKGLSEQSSEKAAWSTCYRGIALIAEGLLTLENRRNALPSVIPHLAVSGGKAKTPKKAPEKTPKKTP